MVAFKMVANLTRVEKHSPLIDDLFNYNSINRKLLDLFECPLSNHYNYTKEDLDYLLMHKHYISGWLSLFVISLGILANSVTICALLHKHMRKSSTNAYLLALSFSNLVSLTCLLLMVGLRFTLVHPYRVVYCKHWYENFISIAIPFITPLNHIFQLSGIYLIMAVSIDRFILVKRHAKPTNLYKKRRKMITWLIIFSIFLFSIVFTIPNWFLYKSKQVELNTTAPSVDTSIEISSNFKKSASSQVVTSLLSFSSTRPPRQQQQEQQLITIKHYRNEYTKFGESVQVKRLLNIYLYIPFVFGVPIVMLFVINFLIIYELIKIGARKRQLGAAAKLDRNITIMLVMIIIVFLICQVPLMISHVLLTYNSKLQYEKKFFFYNSFSNFLTCVNLSANFALFCFFAQAFRDTIKFMFCITNDLPDQAKRAPSLFVSTDFSRRNSSLFLSVFNSMIGVRRSSATIETNGKSLPATKLKYRKSLPAFRRQRSKEKCVENEQIKKKLLNDNNYLKPLEFTVHKANSEPKYKSSLRSHTKNSSSENSNANQNGLEKQQQNRVEFNLLGDNLSNAGDILKSRRFSDSLI
jgi:hypothetical protein